MENEVKSFLEMSNRELFLVLTGDKGIMAQTTLQNLLREYLAKYTETADLGTMVRKMLEEK